MSLHKLTAGDGYAYLTRQVAVLDAADRGYTSLGDYYAQRGESPGVWMGRGLVGLSDFFPTESAALSPGAGQARPGASVGAVVSEAQMVALFGQGRHPDAERIEQLMLAAGNSAPAIAAATRLGSPYIVREGATDFRTRVAQGFPEHNAALGVPRDWPVQDVDRARIRTQVADAMFAEQYGRLPLDARERSGFIARASRQATTAVAGYDLTFSPVKSVSALWAIAALEVMRTIEAAHAAAVADTLAWLEDHAAYTRLGRAGVQQVDVRGLLAVAFAHRDSRAGDPDLHTHVAISNKVQTLDGRWLALDGRTMHKLAVAASERYNTRLEGQLVDRLGVAFAPRAGGDPARRPVRELVGFHSPVPDSPGQSGTKPSRGTGSGTGAGLLAAWSRRRAAIDRRRGELAAAFQTDHGRPPSPVEAIRLAQQATLETRDAKHAPRTHAEQRATWRRQAVAVLGGERQVTALLEAVLGNPRDRAQPRPNPLSWTVRWWPGRLRQPGDGRGAPPGTGTPGMPGWVEQAAASLVAVVEGGRATWQEGHLQAEAERYVRAADIPLGELDAAVDALVAHAVAASIALGDPDPVIDPPLLRRRDGSSVYTVAGTRLYTSSSIVAAERALLAIGARTGGRSCSPAAVEVALLESAAHGVDLNPGQAYLVRALACSGARLQLALAPAGTGKTTALSVLARAWTTDGGTVIGLAPSAAAAAVLRAEIGAATDTLAKLLDTLHAAGAGRTVPDWVAGIGPGTLVLIDEAGMAATRDLAEAVAHITACGGSVRLIGDDQQLAAVGAGGVLRDIADVVGAVTLCDVVRFTDPAEGAASLALREGDPAALGFYLDHGRVHVGDPATAADQAYGAWAADRAAGRDAVMLAPTREVAAALNARAQADRLTTPAHPTGPPGNLATGPAGDAREVAGDVGTGDGLGPGVTLADGSQVWAGDVIITRANDRRLAFTATDWVKNGDRWQVDSVHPDGALSVTHLATRRRTRLPAGYVTAHVTLGYATTVHAAQGITADVSHTVALGPETRQLLYVALTRGRTANHLYLAATSDGDQHTVITRDALLPPTAADLLTRILARDGAQTSATTTARHLASATRRLGEAAARYADAVATAARHHLGPDALAALDAAADRALPGLIEQPAWPALQAHLALIAVAGGDPAEALHTAITERELDTAADPAAVLDWRLDPTGRHHTPPGPLPWLPGIPAALASDPEWGRYLTARADLVTTLTATVQAEAADWSSATAPAWALPVLDRGSDTDPTLTAELAVWRAATGVEDHDRRPTGPGPTSSPRSALDRPFGTVRTVAETRHQQRLEQRVTASLGDPRTAAARWAPLADAVCARLVRDPHWPVLADRLTHAAQAGIDIAPLLVALTVERPLPDEHPAAALWWRLSRHLPAAALAPSTSTATTPAARQERTTSLDARIFAPSDPSDPSDPSEPSDPRDETLPADPPVPHGASRTLAPTALPHATADLPALAHPTVNATGAEVTRSRILQLNTQALEFFTRCYPTSWGPCYLTDRLGTDPTTTAGASTSSPGQTRRGTVENAPAGHPPGFVAGYAPPGWTTLIDHLRHHGATDTELLAAGLAARARTSTLIDRFRDRLLLPIHGPDGIYGFTARRNPHHDHPSPDRASDARAGPKYLNTPETTVFHKGDLLYGLTENAEALAAGARPVLVEGPIDAIAVTLAGNGRYVGVAPLGTALTDTQADHLRPYLGPGKPGVIVGTDADTAGQTAAERAYWLLTTRGDRPDRLTLPEGLDPADFLHQSGPSTLLDALDHPTDLASLLIDRRVDAYTDILRFAEGRIAVARAVAPVIAALPIQAWLPITENLAARLYLPAVTVGLIVFDAGQAQETSSLTTARQHSPVPPEPTTPASRNLPSTPSNQASSATRSHRAASTSTAANHAAPPLSASGRPTPPPPPHHR